MWQGAADTAGDQTAAVHNYALCILTPSQLQFCTVAYCCVQWALTAHTACCGWAGAAWCAALGICFLAIPVLHLPWHPGLAYVQPMQALCEGSRLASSQWQGGQSSRNDSLAPRPPHGWWEIISIHSCKASLEHNTTPNSPSLLQQQHRGVDSPICFNFCCPVPFWFMPSFAIQMCALFKWSILIPLPDIEKVGLSWPQAHDVHEAQDNLLVLWQLFLLQHLRSKIIKGQVKATFPYYYFTY